MMTTDLGESVHVRACVSISIGLSPVLCIPGLYPKPCIPDLWVVPEPMPGGHKEELTILFKMLNHLMIWSIFVEVSF